MLVPRSEKGKGIKEYRLEFEKYYLAYSQDLGHRPKWIIALKVIWNYLFYGCWINNYFEYRFWEKSPASKREFVTWRKGAEFINRYNEGKGLKFDNKSWFLKVFDEWVHRKWIFVPDSSESELKDFLEKCEYVIEKDNFSCCGAGVRKITVKDISDIHQYYQYSKEHQILLEECIDECDQLSALHPYSLNTIRVATFVNKAGNEARIVQTVLRIGNNKANVDNARANGLFAQIDTDTGVVNTPGMNFMGHKYINHPITHEQIVGVRIPIWEDVKNACLKAALLNPGIRFVGWDVVVRDENGNLFVEFIEGNGRPGTPTLQVVSQSGIKKKLKADW